MNHLLFCAAQRYKGPGIYAVEYRSRGVLLNRIRRNLYGRNVACKGFDGRYKTS